MAQIKRFIEENFLIDDPETAEFVPFKFRPIQDKYYCQLLKDYEESNNFDNLREIILKARKEGFTSLVLAIFCAIIILSPNAVRYLEISYKDDATKQHFRRAKNFILSAFQRDPSKWDRDLDRKIFDSVSDGQEFVLKTNKASFYCGTASARTAERGGTVQGVLFSEPAHYPNTGIINASEIIEGTKSMVAVGHGMVFQESTANGMNHYKDTWDMAVRGEVDYRPRFFSWRDFYTEDQFKLICKGFTDKSLIKQEFPETAREAFLSSGRRIFNPEKLEEMLENVREPLAVGELTDDKAEIRFVRNPQGPLTIWKDVKPGREYLIAADIAGGVHDNANAIVPQDRRIKDKRAFSVGAVFDRASWEVVAEIRLRNDPGDFGRMLCTLGERYNWAILIPEANNHGAATIEAMKAEGYKHILRTTDIWPDGPSDKYGFPTDLKTKPRIITAISNAIDGGHYYENSKVAIDELSRAVRDVQGDMISEGGFLDCVITRGIGLYCLKFLQIDDSYRHKVDNDATLFTRISPKRKKRFGRG